MSEKDAAEFASSRSSLTGMRNFGRRGAPGEKPKSFKKTMLRLWSYYGMERKMLVVTFVTVFLTASISLAIPYLIGKGVDLIDINEINSSFTFILILLSVSYLLSALLTFVGGYLMAGISQRIVMRLRETLFNKLKKLPISFFDRRTHGEIMSRLSNDIDNISVTISQSTTQLMSLFITIFGSLIMMLILSPLLTLAAMVAIPLVYILTKQVTKRTSVLFRKQQGKLGQLNGQIEETISGIEVVRAFNQEEHEINKLMARSEELCMVGMRANIFSGLIMPIMNVINNLTFTLIAFTGGLLVYHGWITVGVIASFLTYSRQFGRPLNELASTYNTLQTAVAGAERVFEVMDEEEECGDDEDALVLEEVKGDVSFIDVSFHYKEDTPIIKNLSFDVKSGSRVAFVGKTGAGKTTIVNLLTRFYDVTNGVIKIDGVDIKKYTRHSLRTSFAMVLQDTYLFSGSILENIRYGNLEATDDEVVAAAKKACAHPFIERLPNGYHTYITESGSNLSHGQRQLLSIARAILKDTQILILDEATSNVDTRTEKTIQKAMLELLRDKTAFIIAHRLSTIKDCDMIIVIDDGEMVEYGTHDELLRQKGIYYTMYQMQIK